MNLIVAVDKNWAIGKQNKLLYHLPEDLKYFKEKTLNKTIIMGDKTVFSLPGGKVLPNRNTIVMSLDNIVVENAIVVHSVNELFNAIKEIPEDDIFVCGGASIYKLLCPYCKKAYITKIDAETVDADTFFPNLDLLKNWQILSSGGQLNNGEFGYEFLIYENIDVKNI